jgi:hypothetical protein
MANQFDEADHSWFNAEEYKLQHRLDVAGWAEMLKVRVALKEQYQNHPDRKSNIREREQFWAEYCKSVAISNFFKKKHDPKGPAPPSRSSLLVEVTSELLSSEQRERIIGWWMGMSGYRALLVNPWANYDDLKKQFDQWLRKLGKEFESPFKRRGRPGTNIGVTKLHLSSWADHSVLAVFDLDFHSEVFAMKKLSRSTLHKMIGPESPNAVEWAKRARHLVQQAVSGREFVIAKARSEAK